MPWPPNMPWGVEGRRGVGAVNSPGSLAFSLISSTGPPHIPPHPQGPGHISPGLCSSLQGMGAGDQRETGRGLQRGLLQQGVGGDLKQNWPFGQPTLQNQSTENQAGFRATKPITEPSLTLVWRQTRDRSPPSWRPSASRVWAHPSEPVGRALCQSTGSGTMSNPRMPFGGQV